MYSCASVCPAQAPFCVHPKTGKVCVPINPAAAWEFDPDEVPTVQQLVKELAEQQQAAGADAASKVRLCWAEMTAACGLGLVCGSGCYRAGCYGRCGCLWSSVDVDWVLSTGDAAGADMCMTSFA
jgi:hypothetical protein